jgi:peptidyl-tRNA hydrolase, PTH1 family
MKPYDLQIAMKCPRFLFIASIGNLRAPYTFTRHSAGHTLLTALEPLLLERIHPQILYQTWQCPSLMNVSGPPLTRRLKTWLSDRRKILRSKGSGHDAVRFQPILVILHDELEAGLGQLKVRRGGPNQASLRGHRGLISVMESLHGAGLDPQRRRGSWADDVDLAILRIGVGIGRPASRRPEDVADYVLAGMSRQELVAVQAAAEPVVDILVDELYRIAG